MEYVDIEEKPAQKSKRPDLLGDEIRQHILDNSKTFKTSWLNLGRYLYTAWQDKLYHTWGFDKFEDYTEEELGLKKPVCLKLLKTYLFLEEDEPDYLQKGFVDNRTPKHVPGLEEINVLRLAKQKKEILKSDYASLKKAVFDKGKDASVVRKELTTIIKERKQLDPEEEREKRNEASIKRFLSSLKTFKTDMETLKLLPANIVDETTELMSKLERHVRTAE
jgi:hypothetical protein